MRGLDLHAKPWDWLGVRGLTLGRRWFLGWKVYSYICMSLAVSSPDPVFKLMILGLVLFFCFCSYLFDGYFERG